VVVGLGNPGARYEQTRHNVGYRVLDLLARRIGSGQRVALDSAGVFVTEVAGEDTVLVWPTTFMNRSGEAVREVMERFEADAQDMLIVTDDVYLPLGVLRLRLSGSDGGHNGLASILAAVGHTRVPRLRIGVGEDAPPSDLVDFVLGEFPSSIQHDVDAVLDAATRCVEVYVRSGAVAAMNAYNGKSVLTGEPAAEE
jgi:PTH1 family peptidyl-tRNA hydrolase